MLTEGAQQWEDGEDILLPGGEPLVPIGSASERSNSPTYKSIEFMIARSTELR